MGQEEKGLVRSLDIIELHVVGQALEDILKYELGLPLEGLSRLEQPYVYYETLFFLEKEYPVVYKRLLKLKGLHDRREGKLAWLREIEYARQ